MKLYSVVFKFYTFANNIRSMTLKIISLGFILFALCGCSGTTLSGYEFETSAVYVAERSGITLEINAKGHVEPGADIGTGSTEGRMKIDKNFEISFKTDSSKLTEIIFRGKKKEIADPQNYMKSFIFCFEELVFSGYVTDEIEEMEKVIKGCEGGPKSTYMEGQTKLLKVEKTEFVRK